MEGPEEGCQFRGCGGPVAFVVLMSERLGTDMFSCRGCLGSWFMWVAPGSEWKIRVL